MGWVSKLDQAKNGKFILARDVDTTARKCYLAVDSYASLRSNICRGSSLYEVCRDEPVKVYFDIDSKREDSSSDKSYLLETLCAIKSLMQQLGVHVKRKEMRVLSACTDKKMSFHIILPTCVFADLSTRREFQRHLRMLANPLIDPAPYSRNCLFRCPNSSKLGKRNELIPVDHELNALQDYDIDEYILHAVDDRSQVIKLKSSKAVNAGVSSAPCSVSYIKQKLCEHGDTSSEFRSYRTDPVPSYYFITKTSRLCLSGSGQTHTSNNFFVYCGADSTLVYRCFSNKCRNFQRVLGSTEMVLPAVTSGSVTYCEERCRPFHLSPNGSLQIIQSEMGTGKTYQVRSLLQNYSTARVLIVCFRVELGRYMHSYLNDSGSDFVFYQDVSGTLMHQKLICQVNSLHRVFGSQYDILILDEVESIIAQISGVAATRRRMCWLVLEKLIRDTLNVLALDASITNRSLQTLRSIRQDVSVVSNTFQSRSNISMFETENRAFFGKLISCIEQKKPVAVTSTSAAVLQGLRQSLNTLYPTINVLLIWAECTECEREQYKNRLDEVDVFMYTATLQAGISIDIVRFAKLFVYITANGPSPAALHQMLARIRTFTDNEVVVTFDKGAVVDSSDEWTYENMVEHLTTPIKFALDTRFENDIGAVISGFAKDWSRLYSCTPFFVCTVHNILESFNGTRHFRKLFLEQALSKGYRLTTLKDCWEAGEQASQLLKMAKAAMKLARTEYYETIASAGSDPHNPELIAELDQLRSDVESKSNVLASLRHNSGNNDTEITAATAQLQEAEVRMKKAEKRADAQIQKVVLSQFYNVHVNDMTVSWLRKFEPLSVRDSYFRSCLTLPNSAITTEAVQNRIAQVMQCEGSHLTSHGIIFAIANMQRSTNGIKIALAHQVLRDVGFDHIFDTEQRVLNKDGLKTVTEHQDSIARTLALRMTQPVTDDNSAIQFVNKILQRTYKAKLHSPKKANGRYVIKRFNFPELRFKDINSQSRPSFVSDELLVKAKLRI